MALTTVTYSSLAPITVTITLASLASSTSLNSGRESTFIQSSTYGAVDYHVGGLVTTSSTGATASRSIEVWSYGSWNGTVYSGGCTGTDNNITFASEKMLLKQLTAIPTDATSSHTYEWGPFSIANAFGGMPPPEWGLVVLHNTGAALNAASSLQSVQFTPLYYTST